MIKRDARSASLFYSLWYRCFITSTASIKAITSSIPMYLSSVTIPAIRPVIKAAK